MTCSFCKHPAKYRINKGDLIALFCLTHMYSALQDQGLGENDFISLPRRHRPSSGTHAG